MSELVLRDHLAYACILMLLVIGLFGMLMKRNLVKKLIGMTIFQGAIILFFVAGAFRWGGTVPVKDDRVGIEESIHYINPLPHTLMLTAIVVGVATVGLALALLIRVYRVYGTLEEDELIERMKQ
jgi:multicomponent Na+:H+ antiporter subunit C